MPSPPQAATTSLSFTMHPRVLTALGRDLVTNDVVAVIELVKNSYDAMATRVDVRFGHEDAIGPYLEVLDDGHGMDGDTIENVWCMVATPFRKQHPTAASGSRSRLVTGDKGLGRLSAARLGRKLELTTKTSKGPCLRLFLDWTDLSEQDELAKGTFELEADVDDAEITQSGTRVKILQLHENWTPERISELSENLARLVSPFSSQTDEFRIFLSVSGDASEASAVEIESPHFLNKPKYAIRGQVEENGDVTCKYEYHAIRGGKSREKSLSVSWKQIYESLEKDERTFLTKEEAKCGPFVFEMRGWDLTSDDTLEISERFDIAKSSIRGAIRAHKGISVYRDDILVLPKSDDARDWLGLDLRRVSKVGTRLSTSQIVGYVQITKAANPLIEDTSDRERLASNTAVRSFQAILRQIIALLEIERDQDRRPKEDKDRLVDLFEDLSAEELLSEMVELADEGASVADALPTLKEFNKKLDRVRSAIKTRFTYYSRLATVGTIAQMLIHEIRNRTTAIARILRKIGEFFQAHPDPDLQRQIPAGEQAVAALEQLADRFSPLASRAFRRGKRTTILEESVERVLGMMEGELKSLDVKVTPLSTTGTKVGVDPGELDSIFLNLVSNALYWLSQVDTDRRLMFRSSTIQHGTRVRIFVDDSGAGIAEEDAERIFWPGVTRKPGGIGMGLTVASELVADHGGEMALVQPGRLSGATFRFDLPLAD